MVDTIPKLQEIASNISNLNIVLKKHGLSDWIKKQDTTIFCRQEKHSKYKDVNRLKVKGWKTIEHANTDQEKTILAKLSLIKVYI